MRDGLTEKQRFWLDQIESCEASGSQAITVKPMPETWAQGRRVGFNIRVRPVKD